MEEYKAEWKPFFYPDPEDGDPDPPTWDEIQILQEFVERYGTANAVPVDDAAHRFMSLRNEDDLIQERQSQAVDKGERVSWLLWDAAIEMPNYQPAILKLVEAIRALPDLDRTEEQVRTSRFQDRLEDWRNLAAFKDIWEETHDRYWEMRYGIYPFEGWYTFHSSSAFCAHYLSAYPPHGPGSRELSIALRIPVFALEQEPWKYGPVPLPPPSPSLLQRYHLVDGRVATNYILMLNTDVHAMVPFFEIAGSIIFKFVGKKDLTLAEANKKPDWNLWKGDSSFSKERWDFWKERLQWISEQNELMERTRDDAQKLVEIMHSIEQQSREKNSAR
ncbi:hypothetical protein DTO006G1_5917 [Penicillium roqueforti]|uniref:uncharacterized protein n=1 Tax=Penicillium roqueforti TaxID=5082 RepID=UPI00190DAFAA|nr:uncharacterized protein LCP9604111_4058 [Penicillium roqueforti]KAF9249958.1 hypothetical protein LCP9604111_4058 [Penicillium roqueforti]KAI1837185.1 hypothetical protein CBS147337_2437 [Penicillium roqueforti]KAI2684822.1 hypothetical protein LCP963914a_4914 [Penicillium roqueforti]KAI2704603.1 hypothetical protein CBS147372_3072 [Penicillium roqueforti]KAI2715527.1 hypothetical protein CBS147318_6127 [Penicillium roqueforti]